jgi:DNA-binding transcriptional LysR family regulator
MKTPSPKGLFDEELLILRPSVKAVRGSNVGFICPDELASAKFLLYPARSKMRTIIENSFRELNIVPQIVMEANDTEVIKKLVESGFGYSILPKAALRGQPHSYHLFQVREKRIVHQQALAMMKSEYPRALTLSIANFYSRY